MAQNLNQMSRRIREQSGQIEENRKRALYQNLKQERMEKRRKDMVANISHELKTPLAVISSQAEMLEYTKENQEYYVASIKEEVERMSEMVSRFLDSSVVEHQMEHMVQERLDMKEIMEYTSMKYEGLANKKKLRIETFFSEDCFVYGG